ncbi:uncharacterized protein LOC131258027 [Magnolia sinica]|uniref:uncharacterized protein LOC131258027 n=1 Tax=Magnolia sinica TaxID=86752 RepID=UPI00265B2886|nr:uncharacterized protein LOC131258027 [Magnolia sinica]
MAGVAAAAADLLFFLPQQEEEEEDPEDVIGAEDSIPFWPTDFDHDEIYVPDPFSPDFHDFPPSQPPSNHHPILISDTSDEEDIDIEIDTRIREFKESGSDSDYLDGGDEEEEEEDQVSLIFDLFDRCPQQIQAVDNDSVMSPFPEMNEPVDVMIGEDFGDGFFIGQRNSVSEPGESSGVLAVEPDGLRIVGIGSDSDSDNCPMVGANWNSDGEDAPERIDDDLGLPLCWDCLRLDDRRDMAEDFEWEEVDGRAIYEREPLSVVIDAELDSQSDSSLARSDQETAQNLDWEVLLTINRLERTTIVEHEAEWPESYLGDHDDEYIYTTEYEVLFGQFAETDNPVKGSPPAAKSFIENLPSVVLTKEDVENNNAICAVCKDGISVEEQVKQLPCSHHYHKDCILPWLKIRNTCPVCRHELPTDDPDYERWRAERRTGDSRARYEFEMFPEL